MRKTNVPEPLATILYTHFNVNGFTEDWPASLKNELSRPESRERERLFRSQLAEAIFHSSVTPEDYEKLTGGSYDSHDDLQIWLLEVWKLLYGDAPVTTGN